MLTLFKIPGIILGLSLIDLYIFKALKTINWPFIHRKWFRVCFWLCSAILTSFLLMGMYMVYFGVGYRAAFLFAFFVSFIFKLFLLVPLVLDDARRFALRQKQKKKAGVPKENPGYVSIPRSEFLVKAGLLAGTVPLAAIGIGMRKGLYDYHIKRQTLYLTNLPKAFDGLRICQISDIHAGGFKNKTAVIGGVEILMREKADLVFFTGDLVNTWSYEMKGYQDVFGKIKAPLGVYSCLGNHDYGDYHHWTDTIGKAKNHNELIAIHKNMGWDLLRNENRRIKVGSEEIGLLGVENWGLYSSQPKYGRLDLATKNINDLPVNLLLSHDPTHWRAQVLQKYPQIDVMFAGHTHGMQFGVQTDSFKWSPVEYIYKEWAGLYSSDKQQLYVNVGFGSFGLPGRLGILPEITIFTLKSGNAPKIVKA